MTRRTTSTFCINRWAHYVGTKSFLLEASVLHNYLKQYVRCFTWASDGSRKLCALCNKDYTKYKTNIGIYIYIFGKFPGNVASAAAAVEDVMVADSMIYNDYFYWPPIGFPFNYGFYEIVSKHKQQDKPSNYIGWINRIRHRNANKLSNHQALGCCLVSLHLRCWIL